MSADNFYVIRKHPSGGFAAVMGFVSNDDAEVPAEERHRSFATVGEALDFAEGEYSEYGVTVHPECRKHYRKTIVDALKTRLVGTPPRPDDKYAALPFYVRDPYLLALDVERALKDEGYLS